MFPFGYNAYLLGGAARLRHTKASMSLTVSNTTGSVTVFTLTGTVLVYGIWGEVTTVLSSNVTAAYLELSDGAATPDITLPAGVVLSSAPVGSLIYKESLVAAALQYKSNAAAFIEEPATAGDPPLSQFIIGKKTAATTTVVFTYTTTNTPSTGAILWNALWIPLSTDGNLA